MTPYKAGYEHGLAGGDITDNPHANGEHIAWKRWKKGCLDGLSERNAASLRRMQDAERAAAIEFGSDER